MKQNQFTAKYMKAYTKHNKTNIIRLQDENGQTRILIMNPKEQKALKDMHHWYNWSNICKMKNVTENFRTFLSEQFNFKKIEHYDQATYIMNIK
jgi:5'(3')-deoxyribonucleotidase